MEPLDDVVGALAGHQPDDRRLVHLGRGVVDELVDPLAVEALGQVDHHAGPEAHDALDLRLATGGLTLDDAERVGRPVVVLRVVEHEVLAGVEVERHVGRRAGRDLPVAAALQRHRGEERVLVVHRLLERHPVVQPGHEDVLSDLARRRLEGDVDRAARHLGRRRDRGVVGSERDLWPIALRRRFILVATPGESAERGQRQPTREHPPAPTDHSLCHHAAQGAPIAELRSWRRPDQVVMPTIVGSSSRLEERVDLIQEDRPGRLVHQDVVAARQRHEAAVRDQ